MGGKHSHPKIKCPRSKQQENQQQGSLTPNLSVKITSPKCTNNQIENPRPQRPKTLQPLSLNRIKVFSQHNRGPSNTSCFPNINRNVYYNSHVNQTSSWLPPQENWSSGGMSNSFPYGWETAVDKDGKTYFINHLNKTTTYEDPRKDAQEDPPQPRQIELLRDTDMGFGFVAGSEKPVIVRFVTEGGPSVDKLLPGDQILEINGEDVKKAPRDHVIQLVRSCKESVTLTVCQPPLDNSARKSALLSAAKKQRLKHNPSRVRFAESVDINGSASLSPSQISSSESTTPFMPNVLKVFLENGQTKSFKYDTSTTVGDVLESLHQKLGIKCQEHFSLVVEHVKSLRRNKLTILDPLETLTKIAARPGAQHLRCLYRLTFVPRDAYDLLRKDSVAFEYLYLQCCNDVIQERFSPELKYDVALRLAALHIHQHSSTSSTNSKISIKAIERDCGLDRFVPSSLVESMKRKELRKLLSHFLKLHGSLTAPGQKQLTALQSKLHYLKIISDLPSYGAKCFSTNVMDGSTESVLLISPRFGISQITGIRNSMPEPLCEIEQVTSVTVSKEDDMSRKVEIGLKHPDKENLVVSLEDRDAEELVLVLQGYYKLLTEKALAVSCDDDSDQTDDRAPPYLSSHCVQTTPWNFINGGSDVASERISDFSMAPPYQQLPEGYKMPNGDIARYDDPDAYGNNLRLPLLDSNMNKTMSIYENSQDNYDISTSVPSAGLQSFYSSDCHNLHPTVQPPQTQPERRLVKSVTTERRNAEAINSSAIEMHQIVEDAEAYLSDADGETTDAESVRSESYGKLKHSDSLLLLTQGQKLVAAIEPQECEERSESDTDSQSTPTMSPAHRPNGTSNPPSRPSSIIKTSDSSFGLHSPDNLPVNLESQEENIKALIRQLEDNSGLPYNFAEGTLYLDPDIIDLTMIPPPITPDDEGAKMLPPQLSTPPTPFADRETLDQELKALERDVGDLRKLTNTRWSDEGTIKSISESSNAGTSDTEDTMSLSSVSTSHDSVKRNSASLASLLKKNGSIGGPGFTLAALRQLGINLGEGEDIDAFIANLTIPPPPEGSGALNSSYKEVRKMAGDYDITAFIIPPPPSSANDNRSSDIIRRLYEAKAGINRVVGNIDSEIFDKDNDVDEVRVISEQVQKAPVQSGRVASLQRRFENSSPVNYGAPVLSSSPENKPPHKYNKNALNLVKELSNQHSPIRSNRRMSGEVDVQLAEVLAENDKIFSSFNSSSDTLRRGEMLVKRLSEGSPPISQRIRAYGQNNSSPNKVVGKGRLLPDPPLKKGYSAPSPPLRCSNNGFLENSPSRKLPASPPSLLPKAMGMTLSKSASQGDIAHHGALIPILKSSEKINKSSASDEDLRTNGKPLFSSESKQSFGSSNDSLTSSSSVTTVRSVSLKSLDQEEGPPELPPRSSAKGNLKPPLPKTNLQESSKRVPHVKGVRTPSPVRKFRKSPSPEIERPPAVPSRIRKSQGNSSPSNTLPLPHKNKTLPKPAAPKPPSPNSTVTVNYNSNSLTRNSISSTKIVSSSNGELKPSLPSKSNLTHKKPPLNSSLKSSHNLHNSRQLGNDGIVTINNVSNDVPLLTSSPKLPPKGKLVNGKTNGSNLDDSLDSGSFDQDSLEEVEEVESMPPLSKEAYLHTAGIVNDSVKVLTDLVDTCSCLHHEGGNDNGNEDKFQKAKDSLTSEARQFVTASKLFVKSATESEKVLIESLSKCVTILQRMVDFTKSIVEVTTTPLQTRNVVIRVRDVIASYLSTVRAALSAAGRGMDNPSMNSLMTQATSLAGVLTALMRTLKVFTP